MRVIDALHAVWGAPQTIAGLVVCAVTRGPREFDHHAWVMRWGLSSGLSLGLFVFVPKACSRRIVVHELGHTVQSMLLGPLYVPLVVVPSLVWAGVPALSRWRAKHGVSYYALPTERWANWCGEWLCGEPSMGQALLD